jgi:hypothetical protein
MKKYILFIFCITVYTSSCFGIDHIIDSYPETNCTAIWNLGYVYPKVGHSIRGDGRTLDKIQWYLFKIGNPIGKATAYLYTHSGIFGTSSVPIGVPLSTSNTFDVSTLTGNYQLISFIFPNPYVLVNGTNYIITLEYSGGTAGNLVAMGSNTFSPTHPGNDCFYPGVWIASQYEDLVFYAISDNILVSPVPAVPSGLRVQP